MKTCARCPRTLVPQRTWQKASPAERAAWLAQGSAAHHGRGLCNACYLRAHKAHEIEHIRPGVGGRGRIGSGTAGPIHPCVRCGIETRDEMCRDCRDVVAA